MVRDFAQGQGHLFARGANVVGLSGMCVWGGAGGVPDVYGRGVLQHAA